MFGKPRENKIKLQDKRRKKLYFVIAEIQFELNIKFTWQTADKMFIHLEVYAPYSNRNLTFNSLPHHLRRVFLTNNFFPAILIMLIVLNASLST